MYERRYLYKENKWKVELLVELLVDKHLTNSGIHSRNFTSTVCPSHQPAGPGPRDVKTLSTWDLTPQPMGDYHVLTHLTVPLEMDRLTAWSPLF